MRTSAAQDLAAGFAITGLVFVPALRALLGLPGWTYGLFVGLMGFLATLRLLRPSNFRLEQPVVLYVGTVLLMAGVLVVSGSWTIARAQHVVDLALLAGLVTCVVTASLIANERSAAVVAGLIPVASFFLSVAVFAQYMSAGSLFGYDVGLVDYYLTLSTPLALGAVLGLTRAALGPRRLVAVVAGLFSMAALALSLSRGSLLAAILTTAAFGLAVIFTGPLSRERLSAFLTGVSKRVVASSLVLAILGGSVWTAFQVERTRARLTRLFTGGEFGAGGSRTSLWIESWDWIGKSPVFGFGLGSSGILAASSEGTHPHNLFLQVWLDAGVFAVMLLGIAITLPFAVVLYHTVHAVLQRAVLPLLAAYSLLILEYSKSFNFYSARALLVFGILVIVSARPRGAGRREVPSLMTSHGTHPNGDAPQSRV